MIRLAAAVWTALCAFPATVLANCQSAATDFRGVQWGSFPPEDLGLEFSGYGFARNPANHLDAFADIPVQDEIYQFDEKSSRLVAGNVILLSQYRERALASLRAEFGEPNFLNEDQTVAKWKCRNEWRSVTIRLGSWGENSISISFNTE